MPVVGFISADGSSDQPEGTGRCSFEYALAEAASGNSEAFPYPYPLLKGIVASTENRNYISVTSILHCLRADYLKRTTNFYVTVEQQYPMFRGTLFHGLMEKYPNPNGKIEERHSRTYRGIEISGKYDSMIFLRDESGRVVIQDWKTTESLPKYDSPYTSHIAQINLYRWLLGLKPDEVIMEVWYFSMKGVKRCRLKDGSGVGRGGKSPANQHWSDERVEAYLDDRLVKLRASIVAGIALPYSMVPDEDKWECEYCPVRAQCEALRWQEAESFWRKEQGLPPEKSDGAEVAAEWGNVLDGFTIRINRAFPGAREPAKPVDPQMIPPVLAVPKPEPKPRRSSRTRRAAA